MTTTQDRPTLAADVQRAETVRAFSEAFALGQHSLPELLAAVYDSARDIGRTEGVKQAQAIPDIPGAIVMAEQTACDGRPLVLVEFDDPYAAAVDSDALDRFAIQVSRSVSDDEIDHLWHLMAYTYRSTVRGRSVGRPERIGPDMFQVPIDLSASPRTSVHDATWDFVNDYPSVVATGSPVRRTNRAGAGTSGTRAVDAFSDPNVIVRVLVPRFVGYVNDQPDTVDTQPPVGAGAQ